MEPVLDVTLEEGDLLYMPRGWIHQACTLRENNMHSLHLTVSTMQQWAWIDLMEVVVPEALQAAAESETSSSIREGLPSGFMDYMGVQYEETQDENLPSRHSPLLLFCVHSSTLPASLSLSLFPFLFFRWRACFQRCTRL